MDQEETERERQPPASATPASAPAATPASGWRPDAYFSLIFALCALPFIWRVSSNIALALRFDDALIVLRYARNLVAGEGFVFNPGEHILGVTTPLHTLFSAIYVMLGGEKAPEVQNFAGVLCLVLEAWLAAMILRRAYPSLVAAIAALLIVNNMNFNYLYFGMETHLFAVFMLLACYLFMLRKTTWTGVVLGLAFLTRYDAALLALLIGLPWLVSGKIADRKKLIALTVAFFAVVTPWLLFAYVYFGSILPHALGAKEGFYSILGYLRHVVGYYLGYFTELASIFTSNACAQSAVRWLVPLLCLAGGVGLARKAPKALVLVAFVGLQVLTYAALGPDPGFYWHYYPLNPVLTMLFIAGAYEAGRFLWRRFTHGLEPTWWSRAVPVTVLVVVIGMASWSLHRRLVYVYELDPFSKQMFEIAGWLDERYGEETSLLQPAIGILGYASDLRIIDHAGLVTPGLYYYDGTNHTPIAEVLELYRPDLALVPEKGPDGPALEQFGYRRIEQFAGPDTFVLYERPAASSTG